MTHLPFRAWCKTRVAAKARQAYHTKQPDRRDCLQLDFGFLTEGNRQDAVLVVTDARTGCCAALLCETKHTTETLIRFVLSFKNETGRTHTPIQTDDEEATKALAKAVSRRIGSRRSRVQHTRVKALVRQSDAYRHFGHNFELYEHRWATNIQSCKSQRLIRL